MKIPLSSEIKDHIFFVVVGEISNCLRLLEIDDLEILLMDHIDQGSVIDDGNISPRIEEVFTVLREPFLDLLELLILLRKN